VSIAVLNPSAIIDAVCAGEDSSGELLMIATDACIYNIDSSPRPSVGIVVGIVKSVG